MTKSSKLDNVSYYLLPGKPHAPFHAQDLHNRAYVFWRDFWTEVLAGLGSDKPLNRDDFLRQDRIAVLAQGETIVGLHLYTLFDLRQLAAREHSYFTRYYPEAFFNALEQRNASHLMSMEYFSVARAWRADEVGVSLAAVLLGLGLKVAAELDVDACVAPARRDIGVLKMALDQGICSVIPNVMINNAPCDLAACFRGEAHPSSDAQVNALIAHFWKHRIDTTEVPGLALRAA